VLLDDVAFLSAAAADFDLTGLDSKVASLKPVCCCTDACNFLRVANEDDVIAGPNWVASDDVIGLPDNDDGLLLLLQAAAAAAIAAGQLPTLS